MKRANLCWSAVVLCLAAFGLERAAAKNHGKPNIILCMTDDQGWGDVSYNGLKQIRTPVLDSMAASGLRFNRFYAQQSCSPTRASVMTGRHPNRMGVFWPGMPLRRQEVAVAQAAKTAGYVTGHFGKWHLNGVAGPGKPIAASDPLGPGPFGFDEWFSVSNYFDLDWTFSHNGKNVKVTGDGSDAIVAEALKFIEHSAKQDKPFLACVWFGNPHAPHKPLPADLKAAGGSAYFGEIVGIDRAMGTLRRGLRKLGIADNTLVWFCSDNGGWIDPAHPDANGVTGGLRGRKGDMWEGGIRVPAVIEWPARIKHPRVTEMPAGVIDIYPTVVDILGVEVPDQVEPIDGISLVPLIDVRMKDRPRPMGFWQFAGNLPRITTDSGPSAWSDNRYKLVKLGPNKWELYDLTVDLAETTDLAAQHPEIVNRMKAELETWQQSVLRSYRGEDYPGNRPAGDRQATLGPARTVSEPVTVGQPVTAPLLMGCITLLSLPAGSQVWAPNQKDLDAAVKAGAFAAYFADLSAWLSRQVPVEPGRISEDGLKALLKDPVFLTALDQRELLFKHGVAEMEAFARAHPAHQTFLAWLLRNPQAMDLYLEGAVPVGIKAREQNTYRLSVASLDIWERILNADPDAREGWSLRLGIPAIAVAQPGHACVAYRAVNPAVQPQPGSAWKVAYGRGWQVSRLEGLPGPDFVAGVEERARTAEFSLVEHLRWLASALASKEPAAAVMIVAHKIQTSSLALKTDLTASAKAEEAEKEANPAKRAPVPAPVPKSPVKLGPGATRVEAAGFSKQLGVRLYGCFTGGKQVNFEKNSKSSWIEYTFDVPASGTYAIELRTATPNDGQVLDIGSGTNRLATVRIPNTAGLWGTTAATNIRLEKGVTTLRFSAPFQRGVAVRYLEIRAIGAVMNPRIRVAFPMKQRPGSGLLASLILVVPC
jgi:arylsulfatase A-like enzyme